MEHALGMDIPQTLEELCHPQHLALLVYDMQVGVVKQIPDAEPTITRVRETLQAARAGGYRVFFTRHMSLPKEAMGAFALRQAMAWQHVTSVEQVESWFLRDSPGFQITPEVAPLPNEVVLDKITMSAFEGTFLNIALRDLGIRAFAVVGIALEIGIGPTVLHGADLAYIPVVVTDACGGRDKPAMERTLASLQFAGDALFTDVTTICSYLQRQQNSTV